VTDVLSALSRADLEGAEQRTASFMRANVAALPGMSIAAVARAAGVSEPTVVRLSRRLGCAGFSDLKLQLARSLGAGTPYVHQDVAIDDPLPVLVDKVIGSTLRAVADCGEWLDRDALARAVAVLADARRIDCFGSGLASAWALQAQIKLMRLGRPTLWYPDGQTQAMAAAGLGPGDAVLVLTVRGSASDLLRAARLARANGAQVIGVARAGAPLAAVSDVYLALEVAEDTSIYTPAQSQLLVLLIIDLLLHGVMNRLGPGVIERLRKVKDSIEPAHAAPSRRSSRSPAARDRRA